MLTMNNNSDCILKCRFCLKTIRENDFKLTEEFIREIFDALLLPLIMNLNISKSSAICKVCMLKLQEAFDFKSTCLDTEDLLFPFKNDETDLVTIYSKTRSRTRTKTKLFICRLCFKLVGSRSKTFCQLRQNNPNLADVLTKHFPEMALDHFDRPIVCFACISSLRKFSGFLTMIQETEKYIMEHVKTYSKNNDTDRANHIQTINCNLVLKHEHEENERNTANYESNRATTSKISIKEESVENDFEVKYLNKEEIHIGKEENSDISYTENGSNKRRKPRGKYQRHKPVVIKIYTCEICPYRTRNKSHFERHAFVHKSASEIQIYRCNECNFETKHEWYLARHSFQHMDQSTRPAYKCELCPFKSFHKSFYNKHMLYHTNPSDIKIYKCDQCNFQTLYKNSFEYHELSHKKDTEVTLLKCLLCDFKSKHRNRLIQHLRTHRKLSDGEMFHCNICTYKGKTKQYFQRHLETHKPSSEVKMYQCPECSYETRHRYVLKTHSVIHKSESEVTMYECDICSYQSKYRWGLKSHKKTHEK